MHFRIDEILKEKGKTRYWLYIQLGLSYQNFKKIVENENIILLNVIKARRYKTQEKHFLNHLVCY